MVNTNTIFFTQKKKKSIFFSRFWLSPGTRWRGLDMKRGQVRIIYIWTQKEHRGIGPNCKHTHNRTWKKHEKIDFLQWAPLERPKIKVARMDAFCVKLWRSKRLCTPILGELLGGYGAPRGPWAPWWKKKMATLKKKWLPLLEKSIFLRIWLSPGT